MSQFGSGMRGDVDRVRGPADVRGRMQIDSLNAPGVDFTRYVPVAPETDDRVAQLASLFNSAAVATGAVVGAAAQERANEQRAAQDIERIERGDAARIAAEQWPVLQSKIRDRSILPPDGADPIQWARGIATTYAPEGSPPAYVDELELRLVPLITENALRVQDEAREENRTALMRTLGDGLTGHTDPAAFGAAVDQAVAMGVDREQAILSLGIGAAAFAAEAGETDAFNTAVAFLGGRERLRTETLGNRLEDNIRIDAERTERKDAQEQAKIDQLRDKLERNVAKQQRELEREHTQRFDAAVLDVMDPSSGKTFSDLRDMAMKGRDVVGPSWTLDRVKQIDAMEAGEAARVLKIRTEQTNADTRASLFEKALDLSFRTDSTPGLAAIPEDGVEWTDPSGTVQTVTAKEIRDATTSAAMDRIAQADPTTAFARQADWLASNGATNPAWTTTMIAGHSAATSAFNRRDDRGQVPTELPPNVTNAFALSKQLRAQDPTLWAKQLPPDSQLFWLRAELAEQFIDRGDPLAAIQRATVVPDGPTVDRIGERDLDNATRFVDADSVNSQDVRAHVRGVAGLLMASPGLSKEQALSEATKLVQPQYRQINRSQVFIGNARVPEAIEPVAAEIISKYADYVRNSPFEVDESDLTLVPLRDGEQWILFDTTRNRPVDKWAHGYAFTNSELQAMSDQATRAAAGERTAAVAAAWAKLRDPKSTEFAGYHKDIANEFLRMEARHLRARTFNDRRLAEFEAERRRDPINP